MEGVEGDKSREGKGRGVERRVVGRTGKTKEEGRKQNIGVRVVGGKGGEMGKQKSDKGKSVKPEEGQE